MLCYIPFTDRSLEPLHFYKVNFTVNLDCTVDLLDNPFTSFPSSCEGFSDENTLLCE